jgi:hypothetical protein
VPTTGSLLEENLDRVIDSVVRNVNAGRGAVPDPDSMQAVDATEPVSRDEDEARETMADLCGHVAHALMAFDTRQRAPATYRAPVAPAAAPTLNLIR